MLRGINVSGQNIIRMEHLRALCTALGFRNVETYVQSGNIVFRAASTSPSSLSKRISEAMLRDVGFSVPVLVKTLREMGHVIKRNPFLKDRGIDRSNLHVTFLSTVASKSALGNLDGLPTTPDRFSLRGREIYLYCPGGYGHTKLSNAAFEKALSVSATTRNWNTVTTLFEMASKL
jgi:uncharacterized protein (DUF1697 family)